ncbi:class I SAM-dependent methyltransferase, partial [Noviherbaspirillum sp.]|uniref:class I SAM-dependent methyltransferase n=1 Tax=Noviherbaspirillum sp. TaxID=1926288 RepID=UPI002D669403
GRMLDVGCSAGGLMVPFARRGWSVLGTDPDIGYAEFGNRRLGLEIQAVAAEDMVLPDGEFDLVIITGSLEHVFDVNRVLEICRRASKPDGLLLVEGRAFGYGIMKGCFSHNHRRYLTATSTELLMLKHGWAPVWSTSEAICGPTRPGAVYVLGRASAPLGREQLESAIGDGRRDDLASLRERLASMKGAR